jgi:hypothetical protein
MTEERIWADLRRERALLAAWAAGKADDTATPQQKLVRAAETGRLEAIVSVAQPAEPPKMVTPEEREAELRRTGQGTDKSPDTPKAKRKAAPKPEPKEPEQPPPTPNEAYIAEHCRWRRRGPGDHREHIPYGRCLTEYDALSGEIVGDGYDHDDEEDDTW